jgi:hypothetical protein
MTQPLGNCPGCGDDEPFEQVHPALYAGDVCPDSGGECPEWACSACGTGVFMGTVITGTSAALAGDGAAPARRSVRAA